MSATAGSDGVVDVHQVGGVARLRRGLGDDHRQRFADVADTVHGQGQLGLVEGLAPVGIAKRGTCAG